MPRQVIDEGSPDPSPQALAENEEGVVEEEGVEENQEETRETEEQTAESQEAGEEVSAEEQEDTEKDETDGEEGETPPPESPFYEKDGKFYGKLKVLGKEVEEPVEKIIANAQKVAAANEKFQEAATKEKAITGIMQDLLQDPFSAWTKILGAHGLDQQQARQELINFCKRVTIEDLNYHSMSEEERRVHDEKTELERLRRENEELRKTTETRTYEARRIQKENEVLSRIVPVVQAAGLDPSSDLTMARVLEKMALLREAGEDPTPEEAVELVLADRKSRFSKDLASLPIEELLKIRPDLAEQVGKKNVEAAVSRRTQAKKTAPKEKSASPTKKRRSKLKRTTDADISQQFGSFQDL
jgi:hypothetical protein